MSNILQKQTTYLFVDGSNFRQYFNETTQKWFGQEVEFDFKKIKEFFNAEKVFYFDCIDDVKNENETDDQFNARVNSQEEKLNRIREVEGCHIYLGSLRRAKKQKKRGQKEVDVMLAVQMMEHAFRGNMNRAVLLSGDLDFRPLVESLVRLGLFVQVVGNQNHISQELILSADSNKKLSIDDYLNFLPKNVLKLKPKTFKNLSFFRERAEMEGFWLDKKGIYNEFEIYVFANRNAEFYFTTTNKSLHENSAWVSHQLSDLIIYFELKFGRIIWE